MNRRHFLTRAVGAVAGAAAAASLHAAPAAPAPIAKVVKTDAEWRKLTDAEWRKLLTRQQYHILREEGTEPPFTSPLNDEKRKGTFVCAGCELPLFESRTKYDSGTGWPSFWDAIKGAVETKVDYKLILPREEYRCARCGGHQGHVFDDGPKPTGLRYCNNGLALKFVPV